MGSSWGRLLRRLGECSSAKQKDCERDTDPLKHCALLNIVTYCLNDARIARFLHRCTRHGAGSARPGEPIAKLADSKRAILINGDPDKWRFHPDAAHVLAGGSLDPERHLDAPCRAARGGHGRQSIAVSQRPGLQFAAVFGKSPRHRHRLTDGVRMAQPFRVHCPSKTRGLTSLECERQNLVRSLPEIREHEGTYLFRRRYRHKQRSAPWATTKIRT